MATYLDKTAALGKINEAVSDDAKSVSVTIGPERMETINPFVLLFYNSLLDIIDEYKLRMTEVKALLMLLNYMQYGNLVNVSWSQLMRDIGVLETNSTRIVKKLKDSGILICKDGHTFLNPHVVAKGKFRRRDNTATELLEFAADELMQRGMKPNIMTKNIKRKMKAELADA